MRYYHLALLLIVAPTASAQTPDTVVEGPKVAAKMGSMVLGNSGQSMKSSIDIAARHLGCIVIGVTDIARYRISNVTMVGRWGTVRWERVEQIKGRELPATLVHSCPAPGFEKWACRGTEAIFFGDQADACVCTGHSWYRLISSNHIDARRLETPKELGTEYLIQPLHLASRLFSGSVSELQLAIRELMRERAVVIPAMVVGNQPYWETAFRFHPARTEGRIWRIRISPVLAFAPRTERSPNFVGWGRVPVTLLPELIAKLGSDDPDVIEQCLDDIASLETEVLDAIPAVRQLLKHRSDAVRITAAWTLAHLDADDKATLPVWQATLRDLDPKRRQDAAERLTRLQAAGRAALPELLRALQMEQNDELRSTMIRAVGSVALDTSESSRRAAVQVLVKYAKLEPARKMLDRFGPTTRWAFHDLREELINEFEPDLYRFLFDLYSRHGSFGEQHLLQLVDRFPYPHLLNPQMANNVNRSLIPFFRDNLYVEELWERVNAADFLLKIDRNEFLSEVRPVLEDIAAHADNFRVGEYAASVLRGRDPLEEGKPIDLQRWDVRATLQLTEMSSLLTVIKQLRKVPRARELLLNAAKRPPEDWNISELNLLAVRWHCDVPQQQGNLNYDNRPAILTRLRSILRTATADHYAALLLIESIGPMAAPLVPDIVAVPGEDDSATLYGINDALRAMGPAALQAVPTLERDVDSDAPNRAFLAAVTLTFIAPANAKAREAMLRSIHDDCGLDFIEQVHPRAIRHPECVSMLERLWHRNESTFDIPQMLRMIDPAAAARLGFPPLPTPKPRAVIEEAG